MSASDPKQSWQACARATGFGMVLNEYFQEIIAGIHAEISAAMSAIPELNRRQGGTVNLEVKNIRTCIMTRHIERTAGSRSR
jgi:hypothetical protein